MDTVVVVFIGKKSFQIRSTPQTPAEIQGLPKQKLNDAELLQTLAGHGYEVLTMAGPFSGATYCRYVLQRFS